MPNLIRQVGEAADGGYWYAVEAEPDPVEGGDTPGDIPGLGWCAWYGVINGTTYAAVRTPEPVTLDAASVSVQSILSQGGHGSKPYGRIGGQ